MGFDHIEKYQSSLKYVVDWGSLSSGSFPYLADVWFVGFFHGLHDYWVGKLPCYVKSWWICWICIGFSLILGFWLRNKARSVIFCVKVRLIVLSCNLWGHSWLVFFNGRKFWFVHVCLKLRILIWYWYWYWRRFGVGIISSQLFVLS